MFCITNDTNYSYNNNYNNKNKNNINNRYIAAPGIFADFSPLRS